MGKKKSILMFLQKEAFKLHYTQPSKASIIEQSLLKNQED